METGLAKVKDLGRGEGKGRMLEALKRQINFRKKVLRQPILDAKDWAFSEGHKPCDVSTLKAKLVKIINQIPPQASVGDEMLETDAD